MPFEVLFLGGQLKGGRLSTSPPRGKESQKFSFFLRHHSLFYAAQSPFTTFIELPKNPILNLMNTNSINSAIDRTRFGWNRMVSFGKSEID